MRRSVLISLLSPTLIPLSFMVSACGPKDTSNGTEKQPGEGSTPKDPENPNPGEISEVAGFFVKLIGDTSTLFSIHKGISTFDAECKAELGEQINCFVEGEEHKFVNHKISLHYHVPKNMCDYVLLSPFWFVNRPTKLQKTTLTTYQDKNGTFGGHIDAGTKLVDQALDCYTEDKKPTCCYGKYQWISNVWDKDKNDWGDPTVSEIEVTLDKCLGGPAVLTQPKAYFGAPIPTYEWIAGTGASKVYDIEAVDKTFAMGGPIIWNVNFSKSADHLSATNTTGFPWAMKYDADLDAGPTNVNYLGEPYYRIGCYDAAWEIKSEILIQLRDWNTKAAYDARASAPDNYHEEGTEPTPFGDKDINDNLNWRDYEMPSPTTTPVSVLPNLWWKK